MTDHCASGGEPGKWTRKTVSTEEKKNHLAEYYVELNRYPGPISAQFNTRAVRSRRRVTFEVWQPHQLLSRQNTD